MDNKRVLLFVLIFLGWIFSVSSRAEILYDSIGRTELREVVLKNYRSNHDIISQFKDKQNKPVSNVRFIIDEAFDLRSNRIILGQECVLDFRNGTIKNGEIVGNGTCIESQTRQIFENIRLTGTFNIDYAKPEWFGAIGDGKTDDTAPIMDAINNLYRLGGGILQFSIKDYAISSLDLTKVSCVELRGTSGGGGPWKRRSRLLCVSPVDVMIRTASETSKDKEISEFYGHSITVNGLFIDGNKYAKVGINCLADTRLEKTCIRGCLGDGVVLMPLTYPVDINDCEISYNGGNGIVVRAPHTTVYKIRNCEINHNGCWGILINAGSGVSLENLVIQANNAGGLKIQQIPGNTYKHTTWLGKISIYNIYLEGNSILGKNDKGYDGEEQFQIIGLNNSNQTFVDKIPFVSIYSISGTYESVRIEGVSDLFAPDLRIDWTKNIPSNLNVRASSIKIGNSFYNAELNEYDSGNISDMFRLTSGNYVIQNTQHCDYQKIGGGRFVNGRISFTGLKSSGTNIVYLSPKADFTKVVTGKEEFLVGNGVISTNLGKMNVNIWSCGSVSTTMFYMTNSENGKIITSSDIGGSGEIYVNMYYQASDRTIN